MRSTDRPDFLVRHLAQFLERNAAKPSPALMHAVERLIRQTSEGHVAVELRECAGQLAGGAAELRGIVMRSGIAGAPGDYRPLILDDNDRLYFYRYWDYERKVAAQLKRLAGSRCAEPAPGSLRRVLDDLFAADRNPGQTTAAVIAALRRLTVVSGGPGTGKTTAVVRILALLLELEPDLRVALAAPTGKAAARASEAVRRAGEPLKVSARTRARIPQEAATVHRLLGMRPGYIRFDENNPMPWDVVVVDEASMIGVSLMARLLDALRPEARLILLGDRDQLSSVEPGSVLGDICSFDAGYSAETTAMLQTLGVPAGPAVDRPHALADCVVRLTHSYRFGAGSGVGLLADAVRRGDADAALAILRDTGVPDVVLHEAQSVDRLHELLRDGLAGQFSAYLASARKGSDPEAALTAFERFRLLCAFRNGPTGVSGLNKLVEQTLADDGLIDLREPWYVGRPVMVTRNDYTLQLFNGDIGIAIRDSDDPEPRVVFAAPGGPRSLHTPRLPEHTTVFAMTVHKSQGSEFDDVALVLPDEPGELLSREMIYTAITRARKGVAIYGRADVFRDAIGRVQRRASGLAQRLRRSAESAESAGSADSGPLQRSLF